MFRKFQPVFVILCACLGALLPALCGYAFLMADAQDRAQTQNRQVAGAMLAQAETALERTGTRLARYAAAGPFGCEPGTVSMLRREIYTSFELQNIGPLDSDTSFLCPDLGDREMVPVGSAVTIDERSSLRVVHPSSLRSATLLLTRRTGGGRLVGALLRPEAIAIDRAMIHVVEGFDAELTLAERPAGADGSLPADLLTIARHAAAGTLPASRPDRQMVEARLCSVSFPLCVAVTTPFAETWRSYDGLLLIVAILSVLFAILAIFGCLMLQRRAYSLEARMRRALGSGGFIPYFQPIVNIHSGVIDGCEVLVRWRDGSGAIVPPSEFIEKAEATGLILPITDQLIARAAVEMRELCLSRPGFKIGFNLVDRHFDSFKIVSTIENSFERAGLPVSYAAVEITERRPLRNIERARVVIRKLQSIGVKVSLDDAGTGHSGLAYLQQLGMNTIKIDKIFVDVIGRDGKGSPFIDTLVSLAGHLGMDVVAEGVETYEQLLYLRERGVQRAQGYLFGRPVPAEEFIDLVRRTDEAPVAREKPSRRLAPRPERAAAGPLPAMGDAAGPAAA